MLRTRIWQPRLESKDGYRPSMKNDEFTPDNALSRFQKASPRCYICGVAVAYRYGKHIIQPWWTPMSTTPLSARRFRFLAVASALFIVLMLGTGSHADQSTSVSVSLPYTSKSLLYHFVAQQRVAQNVCQTCIQDQLKVCGIGPDDTPDWKQLCENAAYYQCQQNGECPK